MMAVIVILWRHDLPQMLQHSHMLQKERIFKSLALVNIN